MKSTRFVSAVCALVIVVGWVSSGSCWSYTRQEEEKLGRKYAQELEKRAKLIEDEAVLDRVQRIGETLAKIANKREVPALYGSAEVFEFDYQFKVVEDEDVNAFCLPGGLVYVHTGLLDIVESDDELAGVLAHEIAHAAHHHTSHLLTKQSQVDRYVALVALAAILGNVRSNDLNNLVLGAQLLKTGKLSSYTQEAERDADRTAVAYLAKSGYDPEAMLSFMKKLDAIRDQNPTVPLGIFQTHPAPFRRVTQLAKAMQDEGLEVDLRKARDVAYAKSQPTAEGSDDYQVVVGQKIVWQPACLEGGDCSKARAEATAQKINELLDAGISARQVREDVPGGRLVVSGTQLLKIENEDVLLTGDTSEALLEKARAGVEYAIWADRLWTCCQEVRQKMSSALD